MTTNEYQDFVTRHHNLIYHCIRKHNLDEEEYYDLFAIALCRAAMTYRDDGGAGFAQYAITCMEHEMCRDFEYRHYQCRDENRVMSLCEFDDENGKDDRTQILQDRQNVVEMVAFRDAMERTYQRCTKKQKKILALVACGYSQTETARMMGVTHQRIQMQMREIRSKLALEIA